MEWLKREGRGSTKAMAARLHVSQAYISKLAKGERTGSNSNVWGKILYYTLGEVDMTNSLRRRDRSEPMDPRRRYNPLWSDELSRWLKKEGYGSTSRLAESLGVSPAYISLLARGLKNGTRWGTDIWDKIETATNGEVRVNGKDTLGKRTAAREEQPDDRR